jgi:hypothetical protein
LTFTSYEEKFSVRFYEESEETNTQENSSFVITPNFERINSLEIPISITNSPTHINHPVSRKRSHSPDKPSSVDELTSDCNTSAKPSEIPSLPSFLEELRKQGIESYRTTTKILKTSTGVETRTFEEEAVSSKPLRNRAYTKQIVTTSATQDKDS